VLLLNPDAELRAGGLAELLATANRHPEAGIVGCRIDDAEGRPWFRSGRVPRWTLTGFHCAAPAASEHQAGFVTGACMLIAGDLLSAGLRFCPDYVLYCEDADLCERVRQLGRQVWITQQATAVHVGGGSQPGARVLGELSAERLYWLTRAKVMFAQRHLRRLERWSYLGLAWLVKPVLGVALTGSLRFLAPYCRGLRDGMRAARTRR
jgi:GT2 family glycosyltransferase